MFINPPELSGLRSYLAPMIKVYSEYEPMGAVHSQPIRPDQEEGHGPSSDSKNSEFTVADVQDGLNSNSNGERHCCLKAGCPDGQSAEQSENKQANDPPRPAEL